MKKRLVRAVALVLLCMLSIALVACNSEDSVIAKLEKAGYSVEQHRDADKVIKVSYTQMYNEQTGERVYIVAYMKVGKNGKASPSTSSAKSAFSGGLLGGGMVDDPNIPKGNRYVFFNTPYAGYGDGAVRVGNSIIVAPMDILRQFEKNQKKILTQNAT